MTKLRISDSLSLPIDFVTQTQAILAKKRVGKSYTAAVQAEELLKAGQQIVAIDPTGAWWGLKSSADGKHAGFPIAIFGGEHGDVPLEEGAGEVIARAIVEQRFSAIIDLTLFRKGQINRFMAPFLETLYRLNREAMHLFVDEADAIAPQKPFGEEARMLGAMEDLVRRGGIRGIGCTMITQRPAVLNKNVLTQAEILCALRIVHHKDIAAIREWVEVHADPELADQMIASLPALPIGEAWFWSPGWGDIFEKVKIRRRETFDSGATPKAGEVKRTPKVMADVDLKKLGEQVQSTIQRQKENDPAELRRALHAAGLKISKLEKDLAANPAAGGKTREVKVVDPAAIARAIGKRDGEWLAAIKDYQKEIRDAVAINAKAVANFQITTPALDKNVFAATVQTVQNVQKPRPVPPTVQKRAERTAPENGEVTGPMQRILDAMAWLESIGNGQPKQAAVAFLAGYTIGGGAFNNPRGALRSLGMIEYRGDSLALTEEGRSQANRPEGALTQEELHARVLGQLGGPEKKILQPLLDAYPESLDNETLAQASGYAAGAGAFNNPRGKLRTLGLIEYLGKGVSKAADLLFF